MHATVVDAMRTPLAPIGAPAPLAAPLATVLAILNEPAAAPPPCPGCRGRRVQRWGKGGGVQRFRCAGCGRGFNALTGTPLARLRRRELWLDHAQALNDGLSIRATGRRLGLHHNTTFRWRHRWLARPAAVRDTCFAGVVEVVTVPFADCSPGAQAWRRVAMPEPPERPAQATSTAPPEAAGRSGGAIGPDRRRPAATRPPPVVVLIARDRLGATTDGVLEAVDEAAVATVLGPALAPDRTALATPALASPESAVLAGVAAALGVHHRAARTDPAGAVPGPCALRHVLSYVDRLRRWLYRFHGVASHYLHHYLGWRRLLDRHRLAVPDRLWLRLALGRPAGRGQPPTVATDRDEAGWAPAG